jgi:hypothetical protein
MRSICLRNLHENCGDMVRQEHAGTSGGIHVIPSGSQLAGVHGNLSMYPPRVYIHAEDK